jgi:trehalose 6-phosphate synthase/phosphatase
VFDDSWKDLTNGIMSTYTLRTNGAYIERKGSSLVWHYRDADPDFGSLQAKELIDALKQVLKHFPVEVLSGKDYMEVRPAGVNKGVMVDRICATMNRQLKGKPIDFVLCVGDDDSDEFMFRALRDGLAAAKGIDSRKQYTCTVGKKPSAAKAFLNDVDEVLDMVQSMAKLSIKANRNLSMNDLSSLMRSKQSGNDIDVQGGDLLNGFGNASGAAGKLGLPSLGNPIGRSGLGARAMSVNDLPRHLWNAPSTASMPFGEAITEGDEEEDEDGAIFF